MAVIDRGMDRQQLDGSDAEPDEVVDHSRRGEASEGAAMLGIDAGVALSDPTDAQLKNNRLFPQDPRPVLLAPGVRGFDDPAFRNKPRIVAPVDRQILARCADAIAEDGIGPP